jgi:hypothetical protein
LPRPERGAAGSGDRAPNAPCIAASLGAPGSAASRRSSASVGGFSLPARRSSITPRSHAEATHGEIRAEVDAMGLSWLNALWTRLTFRWFLLGKAYSEPALRELIARSRFGTGEIVRDGIGFDLRLVRPSV